MSQTDRVKIKALAEKCLKKGRPDEALKCYQTLERVDRDDLRIPQKIAELLAKVGRKSEAIAKYKELADKYLGKGFTIQAIAIVKIVLSLNPTDSEAKQKLEQLIKERSGPKLVILDILAGLKKVVQGASPAKPAPAKPASETLDDEDVVSLQMVEEELEKAPDASQEIIVGSLDDDGEIPALAPAEEPWFHKLTRKEFYCVFEFLKHESYSAAQVIFREGDRGDSIFFIAHGSVEIVQHLQDGGEETVETLGPGGFFGDFGYFSGVPRSTTARAKSNVQLLELTATDTRKVVDEFPRVEAVLFGYYKEHVLTELLSSSALFGDVSGVDRGVFLEKCGLKAFVSGTAIVEEGAPGDSMFLIKSGEVEILKKDASIGAQTLRAKLKPGEFFDAASMINGKPRAATVKAVGFTEVVEFKKRTYDEIVRRDPKVKEVFERVIRE